MPTAKPYSKLGDQVEARPGAAERLAKLREEALAEIRLYELRQTLEQTQREIAATLGVSQAAISQLENSNDPRISTLRSYLESLGARLQMTAVFDDETAVPILVGEPATHAPTDQ